MKKTMKLKNLDCAHCATKIENAIKKIEGVTDVSINFLTQKLILETADDQFDSLFPQIEKIIHKLEPDVEISL